MGTTADLNNTITQPEPLATLDGFTILVDAAAVGTRTISVVLTTAGDPIAIDHGPSTTPATPVPGPAVSRSYVRMTEIAFLNVANRVAFVSDDRITMDEGHSWFAFAPRTALDAIPVISRADLRTAPDALASEVRSSYSTVERAHEHLLKLNDKTLQRVVADYRSLRDAVAPMQVRTLRAVARRIKHLEKDAMRHGDNHSQLLQTLRAHEFNLKNGSECIIRTKIQNLTTGCDRLRKQLADAQAALESSS